MKREEFVRFVDVSDRLERHLRAAAVVTSLLADQGTCPVVVGGSALEFYTRGAYTTMDLDLIVPGLESIAIKLEALGFERTGASFRHPELPLVIDFPPEPLAGDPARLTEVDVGPATVRIIGVEDLLADRLRAAVYWHDEASKEWAVQLLAAYWQDLDWSYFNRLVEAEGSEVFAAAVRACRDAAERIRRDAGLGV